MKHKSCARNFVWYFGKVWYKCSCKHKNDGRVEGEWGVKAEKVGLKGNTGISRRPFNQLSINLSRVIISRWYFTLRPKIIPLRARGGVWKLKKGFFVRRTVDKLLILHGLNVVNSDIFSLLTPPTLKRNI